MFCGLRIVDNGLHADACHNEIPLQTIIGYCCPSRVLGKSLQQNVL